MEIPCNTHEKAGNNLILEKIPNLGSFVRVSNFSQFARLFFPLVKI